MQQKTPIYLANFEISKKNNKTRKEVEIKSKLLKSALIKGVNFDSMINSHSMKRLLNRLSKEVKLSDSEVFVVKKIELISNVGFGVNE